MAGIFAIGSANQFKGLVKIIKDADLTFIGKLFNKKPETPNLFDQKGFDDWVQAYIKSGGAQDIAGVMELKGVVGVEALKNAYLEEIPAAAGAGIAVETAGDTALAAGVKAGESAGLFELLKQKLDVTAARLGLTAPQFMLFAVAATAVIGATIGIVKAIKKHNEELEEIRKKTIESAKANIEYQNSVQEEIDSNAKLVASMHTLKEQYENGDIAKQELIDSTNEILDKYGLERDLIGSMTDNYQEYIDKIKEARKEELLRAKQSAESEKRSAETVLLKNNPENLVFNDLGGWSSVISRSFVTKFEELRTGISKGALSAEREYSLGGETVNEIIANYDKLVSWRDEMYRLYGDAAISDKIYTQVDEYISSIKESVEAYKLALNDVERYTLDSAVLNGSVDLYNITGLKDYIAKKEQLLNLLKAEGALTGEVAKKVDEYFELYNPTAFNENEKYLQYAEKVANNISSVEKEGFSTSMKHSNSYYWARGENYQEIYDNLISQLDALSDYDLNLLIEANIVPRQGETWKSYVEQISDHVSDLMQRKISDIDTLIEKVSGIESFKDLGDEELDLINSLEKNYTYLAELREKGLVDLYSKALYTLRSDLNKEWVESAKADLSEAIKGYDQVLTRESPRYKELADKWNKIAGFGKTGNVDYNKRPILSGVDIQRANWNDADLRPDDIVTTYTQGYDIGDFAVTVTPILPNGSVLSPDELKDYVDKTLKGNSIEEILASDKAGIVVNVSTSWEDAEEFENNVYDLKQEMADIISDGVISDVDFISKEFNDALNDIINKDYSIEVAVVSDQTMEADNIAAQASAITLIGNEFKVASENADEFLKAFPLIGDELTVLKDGSLQMSKETFDAVKSGLQDQIDAEKDGAAARIEAEIAVLRTKRDAAQAAADAAGELATAIENGEKNTTGQQMAYQEALSNYTQTVNDAREKDDQDTGEHAIDVQMDVVNNMDTNVKTMSDLVAEGYTSMIGSSADWAKAAIENAKAVAAANADAANGVMPADAKLWDGKSFSRYKAGVFKGTKELTATTKENEVVEDSGSYLNNAVESAAKKTRQEQDALQAVANAYSKQITNSIESLQDLYAAENNILNGGKDSSGGGGSDSKTKKEYDWLERAINKVADAQDRLNSVISNSNSSYNTQIQSLTQLIDKDRELLSLYDEAQKIYNAEWRNVKSKLVTAFGNDLGNQLISNIENGNYTLEGWRSIFNGDLSDEQEEIIDDATAIRDKLNELAKQTYDAQTKLLDDIVQKYDLAIGKIQHRIDSEQRGISELQAAIELAETKGTGYATVGDYKQLISYSKNEAEYLAEVLDEQEAKLRALERNGGKYSEAWESTRDAIAETQSQIVECEKSQAEWNEQIKQLPITRLESYNDLLGQIRDLVDSFAGMSEGVNTLNDIQQLKKGFELTKNELETTTKLLQEYQDKIKGYREGSDLWKETAADILTAKNNIISLIEKLKEYNRAMLAIPTDQFDKQISNIENVKSAMESMQSENENAISAVIKRLDNEINSVNDAYQDRIDKLNEGTEEEEKQLAVEKAKLQLEKLREQKTQKVNYCPLHSDMQCASSYNG